MAFAVNREYDALALHLEAELNGAGTLFTFAVDDWATTQARAMSSASAIDPVAYKIYSGYNFDYEQAVRDLSDQFMVRWEIRINGKKLLGHQMIHCELVEDADLSWQSIIIDGAAETVKRAVLGQV